MQPVGKELIDRVRVGMELVIFYDGRRLGKAVVQSFENDGVTPPTLKVTTEKFTNPINPVEFRFIEDSIGIKSGWYYFQEDPLDTNPVPRKVFNSRSLTYTFVPIV